MPEEEDGWWEKWVKGVKKKISGARFKVTNFRLFYYTAIAN